MIGCTSTFLLDVMIAPSEYFRNVLGPALRLSVGAQVRVQPLVSVILGQMPPEETLTGKEQESAESKAAQGYQPLVQGG